MSSSLASLVEMEQRLEYLVLAGINTGCFRLAQDFLESLQAQFAEDANPKLRHVWKLLDDIHSPATQ